MGRSRMPGLGHVRTLIAVAAAGLCVSTHQAPPAAALAPLPEADYSASPVCAAPGPGHESCLALQLVPRTAEARARRHPLGIVRPGAVPAGPSPLAGSYGLRPQDLHSAYSLPATGAEGQTIAIVDAYNDPNAEADLQAYDEEFSLPPCTPGGCFKQVNQSGEASSLPFPRTTAELEAAGEGTASERERAELAAGWDLEISLDIETARAVCQSCKILLVEASSASSGNLEAAERAAESLGANEISNSWGGPELGISPSLDQGSAFNHPGTVITVSAGDDGYLGWDAESPYERGYASYPASSPHVIAVGGTRLTLQAGGTYAAETVWNGNGAGGGGCSEALAAPSWQRAVPDWASVGCGSERAVADVSAVADPYTGLAVHDTSPICEHVWEEAKVKHVEHWCTIGGTSLSSPLIAAVYGLAGGAGAAPYPAHSLYEHAAAEPSALHDVSTGSNGECGLPYSLETGLSGCAAVEEGASCNLLAICVAGSGYDGPTGVGTPNGLAAFQPASSPPPEEEAEGAGPGSGPGGVQPPAVSGGTVAGSSPPPPPGPGGGAGSSALSDQISRLALTLRSLIALNRPRARLSQVAFSFSLNRGTSVKITLARRVRRHRHLVWQPLGRPLAFAAPSGLVSRHLSARGPIRAGAYLLTVVPAHGRPSSLQFRIG
jgi:hypothetical protein